MIEKSFTPQDIIEMHLTEKEMIEKENELIDQMFPSNKECVWDCEELRGLVEEIVDDL